MSPCFLLCAVNSCRLGPSYFDKMVLNCVASLEDLAFEVSYKAILGNLNLCHDHRPKGKQFNWLPYTSPQMKSEEVCDLTRDRLDHHLVGTMGDTIR